MPVESGDEVTIEYTGRLEDGTVFDTSREEVAEDAGLLDGPAPKQFEPITVEIGSDALIEGFEEALIGLEMGETATETIPPEKAYGEWTEDRVQEVTPDEFSEMVGGEDPVEGAYLQGQQGELIEITHVGEESIKLDFNHDLAGEALEFEIEVIDIQ